MRKAAVTGHVLGSSLSDLVKPRENLTGHCGHLAEGYIGARRCPDSTGCGVVRVEWLSKGRIVELVLGTESIADRTGLSLARIVDSGILDGGLQTGRRYAHPSLRQSALRALCRRGVRFADLTFIVGELLTDKRR